MDELSRLRVDMVGISETRRSGMSNGHHVKGVAIGISSRLQWSVEEVTVVD
ncbi:hypothetical protein E2C01_090254 [Portunus trituberculatus]|uniref:Uncharacterized protein n=1 Tax=Portunus trituberculatus TaxID=210409 RepID=A0A5B7JJS0_PORTR|nr:hypothetical protein [Portunus trituberculatus]